METTKFRQYQKSMDIEQKNSMLDSVKSLICFLEKKKVTKRNKPLHQAKEGKHKYVKEEMTRGNSNSNLYKI